MRLVFDRGTIVLLPTDGEALPGPPLPGIVWDPRIAALRCPARFHANLVAELGQRHVRFTDEVAGLPATLPPVSAPIELRPYQEAALASWELAERRGIAVLPTGAGKTRLAIAAIARTGAPALCLVPTRVLLDQWMRCLREALGIEPDIKRKERETALALFKAGTLRALVSAQVLNEGIDVPEADVGIIVAGSRGQREHVQRVGRILRPQPGKHALVYELVVRSSSEVAASRRRRGALAA